MENESMNSPLPGEIRWVSISNGLENRSASGKWRPAVLVRHEGGHWLTMGLTTNSSHCDGTSRVPIPNPFAVGLRGRGFLWGDRLTRVSAIDLGDHIGWVDEALAERVIEAAGLDEEAAAPLRETARRAAA